MRPRGTVTLGDTSADTGSRRASQLRARSSGRTPGAGRTETVTVVVPSLNGWYFSTVITGAEVACARAGFEFQVITVSSPEQRDRLLDESRRLERRTDGLILIDVTIEPNYIKSLKQRGIGLVVIGVNLAGHPSVYIDDELVGAMAAEHLVKLGHRLLAVISGQPACPLSFDVSAARRRGFNRALTAEGVDIATVPVQKGSFNIKGGHDSMSALLDGPTPPTAVFAMSDEMAFGAIMALGKRSLKPGVDVSIVGVDDHEFACVVDLTTIHQPVADHGSVAAGMLLTAMIDAEKTRRSAVVGDKAPEHAPVPTPFRPPLTLIERTTTGQPRAQR